MLPSEANVSSSESTTDDHKMPLRSNIRAKSCESERVRDLRKCGLTTVSGSQAVVLGRYAQSSGDFYQVGERVCFHLSYHPASMLLYRNLRDAQLASNLLIQSARDDQCHNLSLAKGE